MNSTDDSDRDASISTQGKTKSKFHHHHSKIHMKHAHDRIHRKLSVILDDVGDSSKAKQYEQELSHMANLYEKLFEGNRQFVKEKTEQDPQFFDNLSKGQTPKYLLIGCSDSRVPPDQLTKTEPGEIFIHRNVANLVVNTDLNFMSVLQYAVEVLKVKHIIVLGHFGCGGVRAAMENTYHGLIDKWLRNIKDVIRLHKDELDAVIDEDEKLRLLVELNIKEQVLNLCKTSIIQKQWAQGNYFPMVHGLVYDLSSGYLKDLKIASQDWEAIESIYKIDFPPNIIKHHKSSPSNTTPSESNRQVRTFKDILDETDSDTDTVSTSDESDKADDEDDEIETIYTTLQKTNLQDNKQLQIVQQLSDEEKKKMKTAVLLVLFLLVANAFALRKDLHYMKDRDLSFMMKRIMNYKREIVPIATPKHKWTPRNDNNILAGFAKVDSTMPVGVPLAGYNYGDRRAKSYPFPTLTKYTAFMNPSVGVQNIMWSKCLVLQSGDQKVCICTVDAIGADGGLFKTAYQTAVDQGFTIPFDNVILSASHSHSAPGGVSTELLWEIAPATDIFRRELRQMWANMIAAAMIEADRNIRPVRFGIGISELYNMTHNRRSRESPYVNGSSIDPQLSIFRIDDDVTGEPLVTLWNFAIHGTCYDVDQMKQCSDIMGLANELIEKQVGGISMFVNSDAGDISPSHCDNKPDITGSHMLADAVASARSQISTVASSSGMELQVASATVDFGKTHLNLTLERVLNCTTGICLLCETKFLHCHADVQLDHNWVENKPKFTGIRIKLDNVNYGIVTAPGEPIQELGRQIKSDGKNLGFDQVLLFGYSNNHMGYFCTPREYVVGGYESVLNFWGINTGNYIRGNCTVAMSKVAPHS